MEMNTYKILPFFKIWRTHAWKITYFSWFREFAPPVEKVPLFRENEYKHGIRFDGGVGG